MNLNLVAHDFFDRYFAPTPHWHTMQKIRYFFLTFIITCAAIGVIKAVPNVFPGEKNPWNPSLGNWVLALLFTGLITWFGVRSYSFLRLPVIDWRTGVALLVAGVLVWDRVEIAQFTDRSFGAAVTALVFILSIGLGEEFVSRGFTFAMFARFGDRFAVVFSSLIFGFMHIGWYLGKYWDPWAAYWHMANAAAAGVFLCALMIATRSIWPSVVFHGLMDWDLAFDPKSVALPQAGHVTHSEFWSGLIAPFPYAASFIAPAIVLVYLGRKKFPGFVKELAVRWKLVEVEQ